jgi:hypothetical protein
MGQRVFSIEAESTLPAHDRNRYALQMVAELSKEINTIARKVVEGTATEEEEAHARQMCIVLNNWIASLQQEL